METSRAEFVKYLESYVLANRWELLDMLRHDNKVSLAARTISNAVTFASRLEQEKRRNLKPYNRIIIIDFLEDDEKTIGSYYQRLEDDALKQGAKTYVLHLPKYSTEFYEKISEWVIAQFRKIYPQSNPEEKAH